MASLTCTGSSTPAAVELDIPAPLAESAAHVLAKAWHKVMVIGATDRGKSSYCQFICDEIKRAGQQVALVDADIGQKDVGPPATVTLGYPEPGKRITELAPAALYFVGSVSPAGHFLPLVEGTRRLVDRARTTFVIVNTPGLVQGSGRVLTGYHIESIAPDVIVTLEKQRELASALHSYRDYRVIRLAPSADLRTSPSGVVRLLSARSSNRQCATHNRRSCFSLADTQRWR